MKAPIYSAIIALLVVSSINVCNANETQNILINDELQIPGAVLTPGKYSLSIEDRLYDRVIVKIARQNATESHLILAVPSVDIKGETAGSLILFKRAEGAKPALRGWSGLEFVYPKLEAVKLTSETAQSVLAADPEYDKLPAAMRPADMKVVTLWSLSPQRITADNRGMGVKAAKFASSTDSSATISMPAPKAAAKASQAPVLSASNRVQSQAKHLPKTASNNYSLALWGAILLTAAASMRAVRVRRTVEF